MISLTPKVKPKPGGATCQDIVARESVDHVSKHVISHSVWTVLLRNHFKFLVQIGSWLWLNKDHLHVTHVNPNFD